MKFVKVEKKRAQEIRKRLVDLELLDFSAAVEHDGDYVFFPVKSETGLQGFEVVERRPRRRARRPHSLREALAGKISDDEIELLQSSYNVVGDIAVLELDAGLHKDKKLIGETMLATFPALKVVALKTREVSGEYRVPGVEVIAGENRTETIHREHGCVYKLDVAQAYFSPRLGHERMRVVGRITEGERVLVLFAGVGPYAILAAKKTGADVTAVELNPKAVDYLRWNVMKNKVRVNVIEGDARKVLPALGEFDRIIMPLPKQAETFLDVTLPALKKGGIIHYYTFAHDPEEAVNGLREALGKLGKKPQILAAVECGSYSPCLSRMCVDFRL